MRLTRLLVDDQRSFQDVAELVRRRRQVRIEADRLLITAIRKHWRGEAREHGVTSLPVLLPYGRFSSGRCCVTWKSLGLKPTPASR